MVLILPPLNLAWIRNNKFLQLIWAQSKQEIKLRKKTNFFLLIISSYTKRRDLTICTVRKNPVLSSDSLNCQYAYAHPWLFWWQTTAFQH